MSKIERPSGSDPTQIKLSNDESGVAASTSGRSESSRARLALHAACRAIRHDGAAPAESDLNALLRLALGGAPESTTRRPAVAAARLLDLWLAAAKDGGVREAGLITAARPIEELGRELFALSGTVRERPALSAGEVATALTDLSRAAETLGRGRVHRLAAPLADGMLASAGLQPSNRFAPLEGWRQLQVGLIAAIEAGEGTLLGVSLLVAARASDVAHAAHFRDLVGGATADGVQSLLQRFDRVAEEKRDLELRSGAGGFGLAALRSDDQLAAARHLLIQIEDDAGVVQRYDRTLRRLNRTVSGLKKISDSAPEFTLHYGAGRLLEVAEAVVD